MVVGSSCFGALQLHLSPESHNASRISAIRYYTATSSGPSLEILSFLSISGTRPGAGLGILILYCPVGYLAFLPSGQLSYPTRLAIFLEWICYDRCSLFYLRSTN